METLPQSAKPLGKLILLFCDPHYEALQRKMKGVYAGALKRDWLVLPVTEPPTRATVRRLVKLWHPMGIIVEPLSLPKQLLSQDFIGVPTVLLSHDPHRQTQTFDHAYLLPRQPVDAAVSEFSERKLASFGALGVSGDPLWSRKRILLFSERISSRAPCLIYKGPSPTTAAGQIALVKWIRKLKKPAGVLLATDHLAIPFYSAISRTEFSIPKDISVISVDNSPTLCKSLSPSLTSVIVDFERAGENAVDLLERRIKSPDAPLSVQAYGVTGIARRLSSATVYTDRRVSVGMHYIETHYTEKIATPDVAIEMGCSRRLAETLILSQTGATIHDHIQTRRIEYALSLLRTPRIPLKSIPSMCGYTSQTYCMTFFKKRFGMTMGEWRKNNAKY